MSLQIDVVPFNIPAVSIPYPYFHVGDASSQYLLTVTSNTPGHDTLCNSLNYQTGSKFSTSDRDNDIYSGHCAASHRAGWWLLQVKFEWCVWQYHENALFIWNN